MGSISNLSSSLQGLLHGSTFAGSSETSSLAEDTTSSQRDKSQLSPLAKVLSELQLLQQSDPAKYKSITKQVAESLQTAAQRQMASGSTAGAAQLTVLSTDFTKAAAGGQLPDIQDLEKAVQVTSHNHHRHGAQPKPSSDGSDDSSETLSRRSSAVNSSQTLSQLLAAYQSSSSRDNSTDPLSIILSTLSKSGISTTA